LDAAVVDARRRARIIVMVSRFDHALLHLLYQVRVGWLDADIVAIVSNHPDARSAAEHAGIPFHHWPVTPPPRPRSKRDCLRWWRTVRPSWWSWPATCKCYPPILPTASPGGSSTSTTPSFRASREPSPNPQAHARGVKLIGATAPYVTSDLDEGPIIEQEIERVSHAMGPDDLVAIGRDIESRVLARAVKLHLERRVLRDGIKTVVFAA
jgi:formyltetrahydrofolate deformylase